MLRICSASDKSEPSPGAKTYRASIGDVTRYTSDLYDLTVSLRDTRLGPRLGLIVNASQIGIAAVTRYWCYNDSERSTAEATFGEISSRMDDIVRKVERESIPQSVLGPMVRQAVADIDLQHLEKSTIPLVNQTQFEQYADDWRKSLYGTRYPDISTEQPLREFAGNVSETKTLREQGSGRGKTMKLQSSQG